MYYKIKNIIMLFCTLISNLHLHLQLYLLSSSQYLLNEPIVRTKIAKWAFSHAAPSVWNNLPVGRFQTAIWTHNFWLVFINWSRDNFCPKIRPIRPFKLASINKYTYYYLAAAINEFLVWRPPSWNSHIWFNGYNTIEVADHGNKGIEIGILFPSLRCWGHHMILDRRLMQLLFAM